MPELISRRDVDFLLYDWLDVVAVTARDRFAAHSRDTFDAVLDLASEMAAKCFAPHNKKADRHEPSMGADGKVVLIGEIKQALDRFSEAGLVAGTFDDSLGGMQLPMTVYRAAMTWFQAANAATSAYPLLTVANANLLVEHGSPEQIETWVRPMLEGRAFGTMCLSEPHAGSSLADISTKAEPASDGSYRLKGSKMWISGGEHELSDNIVHLVLARAPGGRPGVKGISLFIVPKVLPGGVRNDVSLVGLNHKMGYRGTVNTALNFGDGTYQPTAECGAVGFLVGELHRGIGYMFHMMNEARIGVGCIATALGYAGYLQSLDYAKGRAQGRLPASKDPRIPQVPLVEHADVRRMLLAQKSYVEGALALCLYCAKLVDELQTRGGDKDARPRLLLDLLTPIAKSWPAQWGLVANSLAIQILGGCGYTTEFDVEQLYRDNRLNPIHEGTHGIQGLDLLGRKVVMQNGAALKMLRQTVEDSIAKAERRGGQAAGYAAELRSAVNRLVDVTTQLWAAEDVAVTLANSSIYLEAAGHIVLAWIWLEQLLVVGDRDGDFYDGKRAAAQYFFRYELPRTGPQLDLLASCDTTTLAMNTAWL